jgi:hypothetical protein
MWWPPAFLLSDYSLRRRRATLTAQTIDLEMRLSDTAIEMFDKLIGSLLASIQPARIANSDAKALARYLGALGLEIGPDQLNDLLVLLAVVMIEAGGGLSLAIGMALSGPRTRYSGFAGRTGHPQRTRQTPWRTPCPFGPNNNVRRCQVRCPPLLQLGSPIWPCGCASRVGELRDLCAVWPPHSGAHRPAFTRSCVVW